MPFNEEFAAAAAKQTEPSSCSSWIPGHHTVTITSPLRWGFPVHTTSLYIVQYYWTALLSLSIDVWGGYKLLDTSLLLRLAISLTMFLSQFSVPIYYSGAIHLKGEVEQEDDKKRLMDTGRNKQQQQRQSNLCQTERRTSAVVVLCELLWVDANGPLLAG